MDTVQSNYKSEIKHAHLGNESGIFLVCALTVVSRSIFKFSLKTVGETVIIMATCLFFYKLKTKSPAAFCTEERSCARPRVFLYKIEIDIDFVSRVTSKNVKMLVLNSIFIIWLG